MSLEEFLDSLLKPESGLLGIAVIQGAAETLQSFSATLSQSLA